ncbi:MAG: hypothetical protein CM15mP4_2320 [Candidatus Neomarinimicrobiota bacterium]|nr:MAG: hypothetical protein CM15mP4_2320 [Candidatus Neomarinimicrobiota bacterium]
MLPDWPSAFLKKSIAFLYSSFFGVKIKCVYCIGKIGFMLMISKLSIASLKRPNSLYLTLHLIVLLGLVKEFPTHYIQIFLTTYRIVFYFF